MISFAAPWALLGLLALPVLWWWLRLIPPTPRQVTFPPLRLLLGLKRPEEEARSIPPWLLALRLALAALLVLGAAHPLLDARPALKGQGPLVLVVDDGWAAAAGWGKRLELMDRLLAEADRRDRAVALVTTAARKDAPPPLGLMTAEAARKLAAGLRPKPWGTDRRAALVALEALPEGAPGHLVWLADGLEEGGAAEIAAWMRRFGAVTLVGDEAGEPLLLRPAKPEGETLAVAAERSRGGGPLGVAVRAFGTDGRLLARQALDFAAGETRAEARLDLPAELRNRLARIDIENHESAAAVALADEGWRRRAVGLARPEGTPSGTTLLDDAHYLVRALEPLAEVRQATVAELLQRDLAVLALVDSHPANAAEARRLEDWMARGGVLLRFAGPALARAADGLMPVKLRKGDRALGGALSWREPVRLAPFPENGPFAGLSVPAEVTVTQQILADPGPDLEERTWARLADGTPLVTAAPRGKGWLVLVHVAAGPGWSSLPLSGLYPSMLERILDLARGTAILPGGSPLPPLQGLDGFGRLGSPADGAQAIAAEAFARTPAGPLHPPGYYGSEAVRQALNLGANLAAPKSFPEMPGGIEARSYRVEGGTDLRPLALGGALFLLLADLAAGLVLSRAAVVAMALVLVMAGPARADDAFALSATAEVRLAYLRTGDKATDDLSRAGLEGLGVIVNRRTSVDLAAPVGLDPESDDLAFFPLVYWPLGAAPPALSDRAAERLRSYLRHGGLILFDTREAGAGADVLAGLAERLDLPRLVPMPADHVLTRSYYLLRQVVGRWEGGTVWIEEPGERVNDGVPTVVAGSLDWAGAWAVDDALIPLLPVVPGGEKQREMAYRFGVNLLMVTLTGNYKADQVHLPYILERLKR